MQGSASTGPVRRRRTRKTGPLLQTILLGVLGVLGWWAWRRAAASAATSGIAHLPRGRHVPLSADLQPHDGATGTRRQLVFLDGGPMHGSRVALKWTARDHVVQVADRGTCRYLDSGRTRPDALGQPARVFVAQ